MARNYCFQNRAWVRKLTFITLSFFTLGAFIGDPAQLSAQGTKHNFSVTQEQLLNSVTYTHGGITGIGMITGIKKPDAVGDEVHSANINFSDPIDKNTTFRVGSQSKMFTGQVIMDLIGGNTDIGNGKNLSLDTTINDLLKNPAVAAKLPTGLGQRAGHFTIEDLLNMGTDLPDFLGHGVPAGQDKTLYEMWKASKEGKATGGFGEVDGFSLTNDTDMPKKLIELALAMDPSSPGPGFEGTYSNTNAIILALVAEGLGGSDFKMQLEAWLADNNLTDTKLQTDQTNDTPDVSGNINSLDKVVNMDPSVAWSSGAVVTSTSDLLFALEIFKGDYSNGVKRWSSMPSGNTTLISTQGMPNIYGYGIMGLNLSILSQGFTHEHGASLVPVLSVGHGGSIPGSTSFSGWLSSLDPKTTLDVGLSAYANTSGTYTKGGIFTSTPSEMLFINMLEQLYVNARSDGTWTENAASNTDDFKFGSTGGYQTIAALAIDNSGTLSFSKGANDPGYRAYFSWDSFLPTGVVTNREPVYTFFSQQKESTADQTALDVQDGSMVILPDWARLEGYGGNTESDQEFILMSLGTVAGTGDTLDGQVAAYGANAVSLSANRAVTLGQTSKVEVHGYNSTALRLSGANTSTVNGVVEATGSQIAAIELADNGDNGNVTISADARVLARSYGTVMNPDFKVMTDRLLNNATGVRMVGVNSKLTVAGNIIVTSEAIPGTNPALLSESVGIRMEGANSSVTIDGGTVASTSYSVYVDTSANDSNITLANKANLTGQVKANEAAGTTFTADGTSSITAMDNTKPAIDGIKTVMLNGTTINWGSKNLPAKGGFQMVANFDSANSTLNYKLNLNDGGAVAYTTRSDGSVVFNGLNASAYRSPNAPLVYDAWRTASNGTHFGATFIRDADNLTHESFLTMAGAGLDTYRQGVGLARRVFFPDNFIVSTPSAGALMSARPTGSGSEAAVLAAMYDRDIERGLISQWSPIDQESRSFLAEPGGEALSVASVDGESNVGHPRFAFDYFHSRSSRDNVSFSGYDQDSDGLITGVSLNLSPSFSMAGYFGWSKGEVDFNSLTADMDTESRFAGIMGRWQHQLSDSMSARLGGHFSFTKIENELKRSVSGGGISTSNSGSFNQNITGVGLEAALDWRPGGNSKVLVSPWVAVDYATIKQNKLNESGGPTALRADSFEEDAIYSTLGVAAACDLIASDSYALTLKGSAAWEHQFGDDQFSSQARFASGGPSFTADSRPMDEDAALLGISLDSVFKMDQGGLLAVSTSYEARIMEHGNDQQINLGIEYRF